MTTEDSYNFISFYGTKLGLEDIDKLNYEYKFKTGRKLKFIITPYSHTETSFVTFDEKTGTLFSSDIFGSFISKNDRDLYLKLDNQCLECEFPDNSCLKNLEQCPLRDILFFHKKIMTSKKALDYSLSKIKDLPINLIAPQHGWIIEKKYIPKVFKVLEKEQFIGIDRILKEETL
jgi:flavorubredoxin